MPFAVTSSPLRGPPGSRLVGVRVEERGDLSSGMSFVDQFGDRRRRTFTGMAFQAAAQYLVQLLEQRDDRPAPFAVLDQRQRGGSQVFGGAVVLHQFGYRQLAFEALGAGQDIRQRVTDRKRACEGK